MEKIRNLSLKKTIILYMVIGLVSAFFLSAFIGGMAERTQQRIWWKYVDEGKYLAAQGEAKEDYEVTIPRISNADMTSLDSRISELCDFLETYTVLVLSVVSSLVVVILFYQNKLKKPLEELNQASKMIGENELDFHIAYENKDELGQLCREFEKMRALLQENNRTLWRMVEDEKAVRAAIAHDIRSPLSILSGYQEMLLEFIPEESFDKNKIQEMLQAGMQQIERMNRFIETMRKMTRLEERKFQYADITAGELGARIRTEAGMLSAGTGRVCEVTVHKEEQVINVDVEIIMEVVENLLENGLRYAKKEIKITAECIQGELVIDVTDDGDGFAENAETVTKAFYHANPQDDLQHSGMGMYISRVYCERHGGRLLTGNLERGGAIVKAIFGISR